MQRLEEYIARRKKEDRLDEFNVDARNENMRICVNYIFEYFTNYLNITEAEEKTALKDEKLDKFRQQLREYDPEVREWLVSAYSEHGKQLQRHIGSALTQDPFFFLYDSDSEFRSISYDCYSKLVKKLPMLKDQTEMLFQFIKEYHRVKSQPAESLPSPIVCDEFEAWVQKTWDKHHVNVWKFSWEWANYFYNAESIWPSTHRRKSQESWRNYVYDHKQKSNLFNLDSLYRKMPKKSFTRGRKQEFELMMMYHWLHQLEGDDDNYWSTYLDKVLPALNQE